MASMFMEVGICGGAGTWRKEIKIGGDSDTISPINKDSNNEYFVQVAERVR